MGELGLTYSVAPIVFMGGSLVEHGGQNPIEAIKLGAAVMHGPHVGNFSEIYAALNAARGAIKLGDAESLVMQTGAWLKDETSRRATAEAGLKTVSRLGGALQRTLAELEPYLMQLQLNQRPANA
jgi:3-deoxy-D-manno-octulosonic-acid transferase